MVQQLFAMYGPQGGASAQGQGGGNPMSLIFMIVAIFAVMYFLMIRPQQRQKKQQQDLLSKLAKGDKVVTVGGIHGTIAGVKDSTVIVKIAENVKVEVNRSAVSQVLNAKPSAAPQGIFSSKSSSKTEEEPAKDSDKKETGGDGKE
jgi:preprotein translocase subunit YajC